jgi:hypothetical protein
MLKRLLPFVPMLVFVACVPDISSPEIQNAVIQSLTATMWTSTPATPTATPEPNTGRIVDILNNAMLGADPLGETIDAKFSVIDAQIILDEVTQQATILRIHVECEWVFSDSCTPEQTFVVLMHALTKKVLEKMSPQIPPTVHTLQVMAFDRMVQTGMVVSMWNDVMDYVTGKISGNQLGARITRLVTVP